MEKILVVYFFFLLSLFSCNDRSLENKKRNSAKTETRSIKDDSTSFPTESIPSLQELFADTGLVNFTDKGSFWLLNFRHGKIYFEFNPSCEYWFQAKLDSNKIVFFWGKNMNCNFDRGLRANFPGLRSPTIGEPFGEVYRLNDSTLYIAYYFMDWVKKINQKERKSIDTLFPSVFRRVSL